MFSPVDLYLGWRFGIIDEPQPSAPPTNTTHQHHTLNICYSLFWDDYGIVFFVLHYGNWLPFFLYIYSVCLIVIMFFLLLYLVDSVMYHSSRKSFFNGKELIAFLFLCENMLWHSLEAPRRAASNEYPHFVEKYFVDTPLIWSYEYCTS